jgi:hypothetical protein
VEESISKGTLATTLKTSRLASKLKDLRVLGFLTLLVPDDSGRKLDLMDAAGLGGG